MAIAFRAASTNSASTNDANVTINLPVTAQPDDWAVVAVSYKNQSARSATTAGVASPTATATASVTAHSGTWLFAFPVASGPGGLAVGETYQLVGGVLV